MPAFGKQRWAREKRRRIYFEPDTIVLLVEHGPKSRDEDVATQVWAHLFDGGREPSKQLSPSIDTRQLKALRLLRRLLPPLDAERRDPRRTLTFDHPDPEAQPGRTVLARPAPGKGDSPAGQPGSAQPDRQRTPSRQAFSLVYTPVATRRMIGALPRRIGAINKLLARMEWSINLDDDLVLRAAAPNWATTPAPDVAGGGGPGTMPAPVDPALVDGTYATLTVGVAPLAGTPFGFRFEHTPLMKANPGDDKARQVEVAILDTAPRGDDLVAAAKRWPEHPLLRSLASSGKLTIEPADPNDPGWQMPPVGSNGLEVYGHNYTMRDHGLFVAGIVHSIAPHAQLRLFEVLNEQGVGYIDTIGHVLRKIGDRRAQEADPAPLVVNCSLTIVAPLPGQWAPDPATEDELSEIEAVVAGQDLAGKDPAELGTEERRLLAQIEALFVAVEWVFNAARGSDVLVVAAAGNDAVLANGWEAPPSAQPQARCPAAFESVVGVGALNKAHTSASYSNRADRQGGQGLATLGGEAERPSPLSLGRRPGVAIPHEAVLGAYIGEFPSDDPSQQKNLTGWAWWAGTSFAAPIVSGALAWLVGSGTSADLAQAHGELSRAPDGITGNNDERLIVQQG